MKLNNHTDFILSPITDILEDVIAATAGLGDGIETYPLCDYIMQSAFLKMTGFQEQKMKCICWELATNDYEYRYRRYTLKPLGECSNYEEKKIIYKDLIDQLKKNDPSFKVASYLDKAKILIEVREGVENIFSNTSLATWSQNSFREFIGNRTLIQMNYFATDNNLFENALQDKYTLLYLHRNRCAHNTLSYQQNLPTLKTLLNENQRHDNYFVRFSLLMLIDTIFIELYVKYMTLYDLG